MSVQTPAYVKWLQCYSHLNFQVLNAFGSKLHHTFPLKCDSIHFERDEEISPCLMIVANVKIPWALPVKQDFDHQNTQNTQLTGKTSRRSETSKN